MVAILDPLRWLELAAKSPRPVAVVVFLVSLSMLVLGLRGFRWYVCGAAFVAGYLGGVWLAGLMHVPAPYVGVPAGALAAGGAWPVSKQAIIPLLAFVTAAVVANTVVYGFGPRVFWPGFGCGALVGFGMALIARRFCTALFAAVIGTSLAVTSLGAIVRAQTGPFAQAGFLAYPAVFAAVSAVLIVASLVGQVLVDPEGELEDFVERKLA